MRLSELIPLSEREKKLQYLRLEGVTKKIYYNVYKS